MGYGLNLLAFETKQQMVDNPVEPNAPNESKAVCPSSGVVEPLLRDGVSCSRCIFKLVPLRLYGFLRSVFICECLPRVSVLDLCI